MGMTKQMVCVPLEVLSAYLDDDASRIEGWDSCWEVLTHCVQAARQSQAAPHQVEPVAYRPGLYAVRHIDNCVGERDIVLSFARLDAAGKWTYEETGGDLLTYRGDKVLKAWPLDCTDASAAPVACLNSIGGDQ